MHCHAQNSDWAVCGRLGQLLRLILRLVLSNMLEWRLATDGLKARLDISSLSGSHSDWNSSLTRH